MLKIIFWRIFLLTSYYSFTLTSNETDFDPDWDYCEEIVDEQLARSGPERLWPEGKVVYDLESSLRPEDHVVFQKAIDDFQRHTCLQFRPKTPQDTSYLQVRMIEYKRCGVATVCHTGQPQHVSINLKCSWPQTFVHEIGHALCLRHEHQRYDRDDFLDFSGCTEPDKIPTIVDWDLNKKDIYDYYSSMHYKCKGGCLGAPKMPGVKNNCNNLHGLGIVDADKLNDVYNCQGCHRHRWFRVDTLSKEEEASLVNFALAEGDQEPVYLCRGHVQAEISVGKYLNAEKACLLFHWSGINKVFDHIQLFALPNGPNVVSSTTSGYRLFSYSEGTEAQARAVRVGRDDNDVVLFAGITKYEEDGKEVTLLGRSKYLDQADFPTVNGPIFITDVDKFSILGCFE